MQIIRPAGYNERRCITRDVLGLYGCIVTVATYDGSLSKWKDLSSDDIIKALKRCIVEHPVLSMVIQDAKTERPNVTRVPQLDINSHIYVKDYLDPEGDISDRLRCLLEIAHNQPWKEDGLPQWRVYILPLLPISSTTFTKFHLAFASSHALADGMSGVLFHSTFLRALKKIHQLEFDSNPTWIVQSNTHLSPPLEQAAELPISWLYLLQPAANEFLPAWLTSVLRLKETQSENAWTGTNTRPERSSSNELIPSAVRVSFISHEPLQRALEACRGHNARVTGLLSHLIARALRQGLHSRGHNYCEFIAQTAIDLRKLIPDAKNNMANYISAVSETITIPANSMQRLNDEDWEAIRNSTKLLAERSSTLADQPVALLKYITDFHKWMVKEVAKPANAAFGMSNLGVSNFDMSAGNGWTVEDMVFSQSADGLGAPLNVNVASVQGGPMALVITWWPGMLGVDDEGEFVEEICRSIVSQLELIE